VLMLALLRQMDGRLSYLQAAPAFQGHRVQFPFDRETDMNKFFRRCREESRFFDVSVLLKDNENPSTHVSKPANSVLLCSVCDVWDKSVQYKSASGAGIKRGRSPDHVPGKAGLPMELEQITKEINLTGLTCSQFELILDMWCGNSVVLNAECALKLVVAMDFYNISNSLQQLILDFIKSNIDLHCCAEYVTMPNTNPVSQLNEDMHRFFLANFNSVIRCMESATQLSDESKALVLENVRFIESDNNGETHKYLIQIDEAANPSSQGLDVGLPLNVQQFQRQSYTCTRTDNVYNLQKMSNPSAYLGTKRDITSMHMYDSRSLLMILGGREIVVFDVLDFKIVNTKTFDAGEFQGGMAVSAVITHDGIYIAMLPDDQRRHQFKPQILVYDKDRSENFLKSTRSVMPIDPRDISVESCCIEGNSNILVVTLRRFHTELQYIYVKDGSDHKCIYHNLDREARNETNALLTDSSVFFVVNNNCIREVGTDGKFKRRFDTKGIRIKSTCIFMDKIYYCLMDAEPSLICVDKSADQSTSQTFSTNKPWSGPRDRDASSQLISSGARLLMYSTYNEAHRLDVFDVRTSCFIQSIRFDLTPMPVTSFPLVSQFWSLSGRLCFWYMRDRARFDVLLPQIQQQED
jgi:hypothetical protein